MENLKYQIGEVVKIEVTDEQAIIVGRAEYSYCEAQYFLRYKAADGTARESWWTQSALTK